MNVHGRLREAGLAATIAVAALPGPALAAEVALVGGTDLTVTAAPREGNLVSVTPIAPNRLAVVDRGPAPIPGANCATGPGTPDTVVCVKPDAPFDPADDSYVVDLGDGDDRFEAIDLLLPGTVDGSSGDDAIDGGDGPAELSGGDGDDALRGGAGADVLDGGDGDDAFTASPGPDEIRGGPGFDLLGVFFAGAGESATVTLDDVADDGRPGQRMNAHSDVERVATATGPTDTAVLRGSAGANLLAGGRGREDVDPGAGVDMVMSGGGEDAVRTVDGHPDTVGCGSGRDTAEVDQFDEVDGCESVTVMEVAAAFPGAAPAPAASPAPAPQVAAPPAQVVQVLQAARDEIAPRFSSFRAPSRLTRRQLRRGVPVEFAASEAAAAEIRLSGRLRRGTIARAGDLALVERALGRAAGTRSVRLRLGRAALRSLPRHGGFRLRLRVALVGAEGDSGMRTRTILVR